MPEESAYRVVVFIDYQNVYEDFRRAFCSGQLLPTHGQFNPDALAQKLVDRGPANERWILSETRVYLGRPSPDRDARGAGAHDRQTQLWRDRGVIVRPRPLQYLPGQRPRQKGVDVELAVDVVRMAVEKRYDIGIVASTDTDMLPAVEAVDRLRGAERLPRLCVVAYAGLPKSLQLPDHGARQPYVMRVRRIEYNDVRDGTVYVERRDA
jgi:hypothetical protein